MATITGVAFVAVIGVAADVVNVAAVVSGNADVDSSYLYYHP